MILNLYLNRTLNRILNLNLFEKKKKLWMEGEMKDIFSLKILAYEQFQRAGVGFSYVL